MINQSDINVAILGSGSEINEYDLVKGVNSLDETTKQQIYLKTGEMFTKSKFKMFEELPLMHKEIKKIADDFNVHPAVLYYAYMEVLDRE